MSFLSEAAPVLIVTLLVIIEALCRDASYVRYADSVTSRNTYTNNWPKLPSQQNAPISNFEQRGSTPWPALGQQPNRPNNNYYNNLQWVNSNQRSNSMQNSQRQYYSNPNRNGPNSNFNTGSQYGRNEQANTQQNITPSEVKDDELRELSEALLTKDVNNAAQYVTVNLQGKTTSRSEKDEAPLPLLSINNEAFNIPSIEKMMQLHDNYILETNTDEVYSPHEKNEESNFLDTIIGSPIMEHTRNFLIQKGRIGTDSKEFTETLREIWFNMYPRGGRKIGSSGFEHVFLAELKNKQVSGLHNWLYFDMEEKNNRANYLGYMKKIDLGNKGAILKYHFTFHGVDKPVGSMFIGTSPELEMALYSTCFLLRADKICPLKLNGHRFIIRTYTYRYKGKNMIGSAFPEI